MARKQKNMETEALVIADDYVIQKEFNELIEELFTNPYNYETEEDWKKDFASVYKHCIDIGYDKVPEKDYDFWVVAFHGPNDETLFRKDSDKNEIAGYFRDPDKYCKVWREFQTDVMPSYWVVWPHSESKGWCERLTGQLTHNHVS
jgi:hypothetical protein